MNIATIATTTIDRNDTGRDDTLGVRIMVGDVVTITAWGAPVRLIDTGRRAQITGVNRAGNLILDSAPFGDAHDPIARGRAVRPGYVAVARRDGAPGHEGNAR